MVIEIDSLNFDTSTLSEEDLNFYNKVLVPLGLLEDNIPNDKLSFLISVLDLPPESSWREVNINLSLIKRAIAVGLCSSFEEYKILGGFSEEQISRKFDELFEERKLRIV